MEKIKSAFASKVFQFVILVAVVTAVPLTVMNLQEKKDIRQQAAALNSFIENCSPINGSNIPFGQIVNFSGEVYDNVAVSGTRTFSMIINYPDKRSEIIDTGITYHRLATDPPIKSGCVPIPETFTPPVSGKYTWSIIAQLKEYQGQGQLQSKDSYFYVGGGVVTPNCKTGLNSFNVYTPCDKNGYRYANYECYDGYKGALGGPTSCKTSETWADYAKQECMGRSSCSGTTPVPTYKMTPNPTYYPYPTPKPTWYSTPVPKYKYTPVPTKYSTPYPTRYIYPTPKPKY